MKTSDIQGLTRNAQWHRAVILSALFFVVCTHDLHAQVGNNNPTGASGIFNGQVNTGCSYDPYTGNATRSITDISVAGAVGEYPLALVRTANSRAVSTTEVFAWAGGWNHNYNWIMEDSPARNGSNLPPTQYTIEFPDGRVETFKSVTWDPGHFRVRLGADGSAGVRERLLPMDPQNNNFVTYLILPDGGKVKFQATQYNSNGQFFYKYTATAVIDPHGLQTTLTWENFGNGRKRLQKVTEPAGRYLQFTYTAPNSSRISQVQEFINNVGRRRVQYYYYYTVWLDHVVYYGNPNWTAHYQYVAANAGGPDLPPLLQTCDDPMYPGSMKRIGYVYRTANNPDGTTPAYGQIQSENYYDGTAVGAAVSTLAVGTDGVHTGSAYRKETRGDGVIRGLIYDAGGRITWASDFMGHQSTTGYDSTTKYINSFVNFRRIQTDYTTNTLTGNITLITYPLTLGDTLNQTQRPTLRYQYGWAGCPDPNNRDANNPYYLYSITDEGGHTTTFMRDANHRVTRVDYPDGGLEAFSYDPAHFYQISTHRMKTGGTETFAYDGLHRLQYYSDPYHNNTNNPSMTYYYDGPDRISGMVDALNHSTNFDYNDRGQVTVTTLPWIDGVRYTTSNTYNPDGTLQRRTDELGHLTSYEYDDYRRLKSVTPPVRGYGDNGTYTTSFYYGANPWDGVNDYKLTDSNVTYLVLPNGKKTKTICDDNRRKTDVTVGWGTADAATTSYGYDAAGKVTRVTNPRNRSTTTVYDERNRPSEIHDPYNNITSFTYDTAGRRKTITRPNGQVITNASFDEMNRVLQQNVTQAPDPVAVTKYSYYPSGLLNTMTDPHNSTDSYTYTYDLMGRKRWVTYPADSNGNHWTEHFTYDAAGRLETFKNRKGDVQTLHYDALDRLTYFTWDDGLTPRVDFDYDAASRLTEINNVNATITRAYFNDNLLRSETEAITGGRSKQAAYTYNADSHRANITYPDYQAFFYTYTGRNQLKNVGPWATYTYDENGYVGDLTTRTLNNGTQSTYLYDPLDRVTWITHSFTSGGRGFNYGYDDVSVGNRKYIRRTGTTLGDKGDVFSYDLADQVSGVQLNVTSPQSTPSPPRSIFYDPNGNRTTFRPYGPTDNYVTNNLNQYSSRNSNNATYNANGDITITPEPAGSRSTYGFDAQNRVTSAGKGNVSMYFNYDGLNRQVSRTVGGVTTYNVWDGWDLIEEYQSGGTVTAKYVYGVDGLIKELVNNRYYYQDGSGSTSHVADDSGQLLEWYRYDLQGAPFFYTANDSQLSASAFDVRHLFTGQQWYQQLGLYDLRNRFYSPDVGRFLQPDPIGFRGGNNLYHYCGNNPVTRWDRFGLQGVPTASEGWTADADEVRVTGSEIPLPELPDIPDLLQRPPDLGPLERFGSSNPGSGGDGGPGGGGGPRGRGGTTGTGSNSTTQQSSPPQQNPPSPFNLLSLSLSPVYQAAVVRLPNGEQYMPITTIKNSDQAQLLGRFVGSRIPIFVPPGENPQGTVNFWRGTEFPYNLSAFNDAFNPRTGYMNFKVLVSKIYDPYGNFIYGASGIKAGIPAVILQQVGHQVHGGHNNPVNVYDIQLGIDAMWMGGVLIVVPVTNSDF